MASSRVQEREHLWSLRNMGYLLYKSLLNNDCADATEMKKMLTTTVTTIHVASLQDVGIVNENKIFLL